MNMTWYTLTYKLLWPLQLAVVIKPATFLFSNYLSSLMTELYFNQLSIQIVKFKIMLIKTSVTFIFNKRKPKCSGLALSENHNLFLRVLISPFNFLFNCGG